jgi:2-polyprenyl-3-methyl-5-hydroxy-6-metoxy-1,4-benzoquinol methylase
MNRSEKAFSEASAPDRSRRIGFVERPNCPCCGAMAAQSLWSGRFSDPDVAAHLAKFFYNADLAAELGDQPFDLVRCQACGLAYHRLVIGEEALPVIYGRWTDAGQVARFEAAHTLKRSDPFAANVQRLKLVMRLRHLVQGAGEPIRLLDFGCGDGEVLAAAQFLGLQAIGIDISDSRASVARTSGRLVLPDFARFDQDGGGKVHAAVLSQVLEHVSDPLGLLRALAQRMLPGGVLYVAVPNCQGITAPHSFDEFHAVQPLEHMNAFDPASLRQLAARAGFRPVRRPFAAMTTHAPALMRALAGLIWQPDTTDQLFRLG